MTKNFLYVAFLDFIVRRGGSRAAATSKMERLVIIVNGCWKSLTIVIKHSILDVAAALDPPLVRFTKCNCKPTKIKVKTCC